MKNSFVKTYRIAPSFYKKLTPDEKKVLPILEEAAKLVGPIYADQEKGEDKSKGANLYPADVSDEKILEAAQKNPAILSPYTVVQKGESNLEAIPYHEKYKDQLEKISKLLQKAAALSKNPKFAKYLKAASESLVTGRYKKMDTAWLDSKTSNLEFLIGPYERYIDKRFFKKMAYLAAVGINDSENTRRAYKIYQVLSTTIHNQGKRHNLSEIQICTMRNILFTGFLAKAQFSTEHIPSDDKTIQESGSRLIGYISSVDDKFEKILFPIFNSIFDKRFKSSYSKELLTRANYYLVFVYGLARQLHRHPTSRERLKELFPVFEEVNSIVSGNQHCKHLVMKGVIDQKELEAIMVMHICWLFSEWVLTKKTNLRKDYLVGDAITLNYLLRVGALNEKEGISWPNFARMFFEMENLSSILTRFMEEGTYEEAKAFIAKYYSLEPFLAFNKRLAKIKPLN